jgi:hypothetical protein
MAKLPTADAMRFNQRFPSDCRQDFCPHFVNFPPKVVGNAWGELRPPVKQAQSGKKPVDLLAGFGHYGPIPYMPTSPILIPSFVFLAKGHRWGYGLLRGVSPANDYV